MRPLRRTHAAVGFVLTVLLAACSDSEPTFIAGPRLEPPTDRPTTEATGSIWGYVVAKSGVCLSGVTVEIVSGPGTGRQMVQEVPCDAWAYGNGFWFNNLTLGAAVTIRAKKVGYKSQDVTVVVRTSGYADLIELLPE